MSDGTSEDRGPEDPPRAQERPPAHRPGVIAAPRTRDHRHDPATWDADSRGARARRWLRELGTPAEVTVIGQHPGPVEPNGPVRSVQEAEVDVPVELLEDLWKPEMLERLARAYWVYLQRISLGIIRVRYSETSRQITLFGTPLLSLLRFRRPIYVLAPVLGRVTWTIERGLLVSPEGRGSGHLRFTVRLIEGGAEGRARLHVTAEVANFYPFLRGSGRFARFGAWLYAQTQLRIHVIIGNGFLRSLATLDLPASRVGSLTEAGIEDEVPPGSEPGGPAEPAPPRPPQS